MSTLSKPVGLILVVLAVCLSGQPAQAKYSGGTGEPNDPYQIATAADLIALGETPEDYDKHFILTADIDLDPNLPGRKVFDRAVIAPSWEQPFIGVFDGQGYAILHLTITGKDCVGLFGQLFGQVRDLGVVDVNVSGSGCEIGGLAGYVGWGGGRLVECYSSGTVSGTINVGGLVGWNEGTVIRSHSSGAVRGTYGVAGLVGMNYGTLSQCHSTCDVKGQSEVGGLVGSGEMDVVAQCYSAGTVCGTENVGGLVGLCNCSTTVAECYSAGMVEGDSSVGGLIGYALGVEIRDSYSVASVLGGKDVGGLIGAIHHSAEYSWTAYVSHCFSAGPVTGESVVGGLIGNSLRRADDSVTASFWDTETSGQTTSAGGTGKTTAEMQTGKTFLDAGWDFVAETANGTDDIWWILEGKDYPRLWWEPEVNP